MDKRAMDALTAGLATKADKMRILERNGVPRADIARYLEVRYQQVRNTLEGDKRTGYSPRLDPPGSGSDPSPQPFEIDSEAVVPLVRVEDGSGVVSANHLAGIPGGNGGPLYLVKVHDGLFITTLVGLTERAVRSLS